ncbi:MAG: hypothetical protein KF691_00695 [Phycisphaeraceae bacterium]|nr:hypothetical protein [Phycisphaeraceae bacterium]
MRTRLFQIGFTLSIAASACSAAIVTRNASSAANAAATRAQWLADCGVAAPTYLVDFESGFSLGQNVSGVTGLFPGGLVITDTSSAHNAIIRGSGSFGGSSPNGSYGVAHNEQQFLELSWPEPGVDGVGFADIDHAGTTIYVDFSGGGTVQFSIETTGSGGVTGEFVGIWRNDMPRIIRLRLDASGDGSWGVDDIQWIASGSCPGDINNDGFVDDSDFVLFVAAYNILDCADPSMPAGCPADFNGDNFVDDSDFVIFVGAYNELICP